MSSRLILTIFLIASLDKAFGGLPQTREEIQEKEMDYKVDTDSFIRDFNDKSKQSVKVLRKYRNQQPNVISPEAERSSPYKSVKTVNQNRHNVAANNADKQSNIAHENTRRKKDIKNQNSLTYPSNIRNKARKRMEPIAQHNLNKQTQTEEETKNRASILKKRKAKNYQTAYGDPKTSKEKGNEQKGVQDVYKESIWDGLNNMGEGRQNNIIKGEQEKEVSKQSKVRFPQRVAKPKSKRFLENPASNTPKKVGNVAGVSNSKISKGNVQNSNNFNGNLDNVVLKKLQRVPVSSNVHKRQKRNLQTETHQYMDDNMNNIDNNLNSKRSNQLDVDASKNLLRRVKREAPQFRRRKLLDAFFDDTRTEYEEIQENQADYTKRTNHRSVSNEDPNEDVYAEKLRALKDAASNILNKIELLKEQMVRKKDKQWNIRKDSMARMSEDDDNEKERQNMKAKGKLNIEAKPVIRKQNIEKIAQPLVKRGTDKSLSKSTLRKQNTRRDSGYQYSEENAIQKQNQHFNAKGKFYNKEKPFYKKENIANINQPMDKKSTEESLSKDSFQKQQQLENHDENEFRNSNEEIHTEEVEQKETLEKLDNYSNNRRKGINYREQKHGDIFNEIKDVLENLLGEPEDHIYNEAGNEREKQHNEVDGNIYNMVNDVKEKQSHELEEYIYNEDGDTKEQQRDEFKDDIYKKVKDLRETQPDVLKDDTYSEVENLKKVQHDDFKNDNNNNVVDVKEKRNDELKDDTDNEIDNVRDILGHVNTDFIDHNTEQQLDDFENNEMGFIIIEDVEFQTPENYETLTPMLEWFGPELTDMFQMETQFVQEPDFDNERIDMYIEALKNIELEDSDIERYIEILQNIQLDDDSIEEWFKLLKRKQAGYKDLEKDFEILKGKGLSSGSSASHTQNHEEKNYEEIANEEGTVNLKVQIPEHGENEKDDESAREYSNHRSKLSWKQGVSVQTKTHAEEESEAARNIKRSKERIVKSKEIRKQEVEERKKERKEIQRKEIEARRLQKQLLNKQRRIKQYEGELLANHTSTPPCIYEQRRGNKNLCGCKFPDTCFRVYECTAPHCSFNHTCMTPGDARHKCRPTTCKPNEICYLIYKGPKEFSSGCLLVDKTVVKPGYCPMLRSPYGSSSTHNETLTCLTDSDCTDDKKCCHLKELDKKTCTDPVADITKPGMCPPKDFLSLVSAHQVCQKDSDCPQCLKCCPGTSTSHCYRPLSKIEVERWEMLY